MRWAVGWVYCHLTVAGRLSVILCGIVIPYSLLSLAMPIHLLGFALLALLALDFALGLPLRPRLTVRREGPRRVARGAEVTLAYHIHNRRRLPAWGLEVDSLPFPISLPLASPRAILRQLPPGATARCTLKLHARRRGLFRLPPLRCASQFPFCLWTWGQTEAASARSLIVTPELIPLRRVHLPQGLRYRAEGPSVSSQAGNSLEFLGCREFREGDSLRRIHMRSWARTGFPVVKEFRQEYMCRTGVILDTFLPRRSFEETLHRFTDRPEFEAAVSLAASLVDYFAKHDSQVDLFAAGKRIYHFDGSRGADYLERVLEILACVDYSTRDDFPELAPALIPLLRQTSGLAFVLTAWDETRDQLLREIAGRGVQARTVLIESATGSAAPRRVPDSVTRIPARHVLAGHCREI